MRVGWQVWVRPKQIRLWSFGLLICGWGFRILGLGRVLGTNSHGFAGTIGVRIYQALGPGRG